jgi:hypothetical protein
VEPVADAKEAGAGAAADGGELAKLNEATMSKSGEAVRDGEGATAKGKTDEDTEDAEAEQGKGVEGLAQLEKKLERMTSNLICPTLAPLNHPL